MVGVGEGDGVQGLGWEGWMNEGERCGCRLSAMW